VRLSPAALLVLAVAYSACGTAADRTPESVALAQQVTLTPAERCQALRARALGSDPVQLVAVFESTALEIANWQENGMFSGGSRAGPGQSPLRSHPTDESFVSCYFDGTFTFRWPIPQGAAPPVFERMLFIVDSAGRDIQQSGGTKKQLPLLRPAA
jgi:hypothetical protein